MIPCLNCRLNLVYLFKYLTKFCIINSSLNSCKGRPQTASAPPWGTRCSSTGSPDGGAVAASSRVPCPWPSRFPKCCLSFALQLLLFSSHITDHLYLISYLSPTRPRTHCPFTIIATSWLVVCLFVFYMCDLLCFNAFDVLYAH